MGAAWVNAHTRTNTLKPVEISVAHTLCVCSPTEMRVFRMKSFGPHGGGGGGVEECTSLLGVI